jgi:HK97 family phage major capsid protein
MTNTPKLETKSTTGDVGGAFEDFMRAFDAFKDTNDDRLGQLERRMTADVVTTDKLDRINTALDELSLKSQRPQLTQSSSASPRSSYAGVQHKAAFDSYIRKGESGSLRGLEEKALSVTTNPDAGYLVPEDTEKVVNRALRDISPIRALATVQQISGSSYKKPFSISGPGTGWVGETTARPETTAPVINELIFPAMELYAMPAASSALLDDTAVNIDQWIADEVRVVFAEQEGTAFVKGDGVNKPKGFLSYPVVASTAWTWGNIGALSTGVAGALPTAAPSDKLIDLAYSIKPSYRANGTFVMNRATQATIRKIKDAQGDYIWQPSAQPGQSPSLMGFPVAECEDMPDIANNATAIAFGDFRRGYLIVDRIGIRVLRDPYSAKPYVLFYTTKRVGGGVQDFDAFKLLKFSV